jgi:hypothetical protein
MELILLLVGTFFAVLGSPAYSQVPLDHAKKARVELASEFVGDLEILYRIQETTKKELPEDNSAEGKLVTGIRNGSRTMLEMKNSIYRLSRIDVEGQWAKIRDALTELHEQRISIIQELAKMAKAILEGPQPGVNYGSMTAGAPELTAAVEQIDKTIFTMSKAMFFALVDDDRVSSDGKLHHLLLSKKERTDMIQLIDPLWTDIGKQGRFHHCISGFGDQVWVD